jgi:hypothetical protein
MYMSLFDKIYNKFEFLQKELERTSNSRRLISLSPLGGSFSPKLGARVNHLTPPAVLL